MTIYLIHTPLKFQPHFLFFRCSLSIQLWIYPQLSKQCPLQIIILVPNIHFYINLDINCWDVSFKEPLWPSIYFFSWFQCKLYMSTCYNILHALMSSLSLTYTHIKRMSTFVLSVGLIIESNGFRCFSTVKTFSKKLFYISLYFSFYFLKLRNAFPRKYYFRK